MALTGPLLFFLACSEPPGKVQEAEVVCPKFSEVKARHILLIFFDRSGSFLDARDRDTNALADAANFVRQLPPAALVLVRYISDRSYEDTERCLTEAIPEESPAVDCVVTNPFDPLQKRRCQMEEFRYKAQLRCLNEGRERIAAALLGLTPARAKYTDVWGAIYAASQILNTYRYRTNCRVIIIYSDLHDNVGTRLPNHLAGLEGVKVIVRMARNEDPIVTEQRMSTFSERLSRWGAEVQSIPIEVPMSVDGLFDQQCRRT